MTPPESPSDGVRESPLDEGRESPPDEGPALRSRGFRITVDGGRDSFFAICIEEPDSETAWIMSDTVRRLADAR